MKKDKKVLLYSICWLLRRKRTLLSSLAVLMPAPLFAQSGRAFFSASSQEGLAFVLAGLLLLCLLCAWYLHRKSNAIQNTTVRKDGTRDSGEQFSGYAKTMTSKQIEAWLKSRQNVRPSDNRSGSKTLAALFLILLGSASASAQSDAPKRPALLTEPGVLITLILIIIPILAALFLMTVRIRKIAAGYKKQKTLEEAEQFANYLQELSDGAVEASLKERKESLDFVLTQHELSGTAKPADPKGLLASITTDSALPIVATKKKALNRPAIQPELAKLIIWYIATATFWLVFGTSVGEYLGIKFVAPDVDHQSWLSFGRLRPVHTNVVFWGWASLGMLGLGYYVVPKVSNTALSNIKHGWWALGLINLAVVSGTICLLAGINNGGGEYREYIWSVMLLFGIGIALTLVNFIKTVATRKTKEIYISNWYIVSALIFILVIVASGYLPFWQDGLGETILQGYYMHQAVGMWFMLFTLGIVYYFLPQQLNKPIYSYSLGILAFWTQILFYTVIGTHHFVFSAIPWWLQTTAIVGSVGMLIPVAAGTTNFLMTFRGSWYKLPSSYTLPFFLVGVIYYFTGSFQGTAEAFRSTNLVWHFTDFTVAHSHITMYGIISFFLWAGIYAVLPRLTGREAPQITVGAHFWLAFIGLLFYIIPLMYGATMRGVMWMDGKPFMESVVMMANHWLWRAIGGSLMWVSHLCFAYNIYRMLAGSSAPDVREAAVERLNQQTAQLALQA